MEIIPKAKNWEAKQELAHSKEASWSMARMSFLDRGDVFKMQGYIYAVVRKSDVTLAYGRLKNPDGLSLVPLDKANHEEGAKSMRWVEKLDTSSLVVPLTKREPMRAEDGKYIKTAKVAGNERRSFAIGASGTYKINPNKIYDQ